jgi:hypothetical protein
MAKANEDKTDTGGAAPDGGEATDPQAASSPTVQPEPTKQPLLVPTLPPDAAIEIPGKGLVRNDGQPYVPPVEDDRIHTDSEEVTQ